MIKNFDEIKQQLKELAEVVNAFKSEAVQLRLIELVFGAQTEVVPSASQIRDADVAQRKQRRRRQLRSAAPDEDSSSAGQGRAQRTGRMGGKAVLARLYGEGFFKAAKTINDVVQHADTNLATKLKQSDFSGALGRYVRDGKLKRTKNANNQYEYTGG